MPLVRSKGSLLLVLVALLAIALLAPTAAAADLPGSAVWCILDPCPQAPADLVAKANAQLKTVFGPGPGVCGDGVCDTSRLETCASCPADCGTCSQKAPVTKCTRPGVVALSFDDGPSQFTRSIIELLNKEKIKATFFTMGMQLLKPEQAAVTKFAFDSGHVIGSHTWQHRSLLTSQNDLTGFKKSTAKGFMSLNALRVEMIFTDMMIEKTIGKRPRLFRPPYFEWTSKAMAWLDTSGYRVVNINVDSKDYMLPAGSKPANVMDLLKAEFAKATTEGSWIHLQHDVIGFSAEAVGQVVKFFREKNLQFVTVNECIGEADPYKSVAIPYLAPGLQARNYKGPPAQLPVTPLPPTSPAPAGLTTGNAPAAGVTGKALKPMPAAAMALSLATTPEHLVEDMAANGGNPATPAGPSGTVTDPTTNPMGDAGNAGGAGSAVSGGNGGASDKNNNGKPAANNGVVAAANSAWIALLVVVVMGLAM
ncbi:hypothetical protein BC828DRAFT_402859 [Blastocladiella britannica]|nr:hypothetical protein BC828DRAFT_402859 [Blastocladiella britannica]